MSILQNLSHFSKGVGAGALEKVSKTLTDKRIHVAPKMTSISGYSAHAIYYVPVWVPDTMPSETAMMLGKDTEITYSSFVRAVFALNPAHVVDVGEELNLTEYLHRFHQNVMGNNSPLSISLTESMQEEFKLVTAPTLNESVKMVQLLEASVDSTDEDSNLVRRGGSNPKTVNASELKAFHDNSVTYVDVDITVIFNSASGPSDPTVFRVPIGIKAQIHPIPVDDLVPYVQEAIDNRGKVNQLLRYSTGETLSLMDILFGISQQKSRIANRDKAIMRWANVIEERKRLSKMTAATLGKMVFLPNTMLTLSTEEVETIKYNTGFDLRDARIAKKLIKDYFLLGIMIADELTETVLSMHADFNEYSETTYRSMSKKADSSDSTVKQLIRSFSK